MVQSKPSVFLLNPANRAFLQKKIKRPVLPEQKPLALIFFFLVTVVSLIGFLILAFPYWKTWYDLKNSGVETTGQMIAQAFESNKKDSAFKVTYQFAAGNQTYQGSQKLNRDFYYSVYDYQNDLPIRYLPDNPKVSRLSGGFKDADENFKIALTMVGAVWVLGWLIGLAVSFNAYDQNSQLLSKGKLIKGTVVACEWYKVPQASNTMAVAGGVGGGMIGGMLGAIADDQISRRSKKMKYKIRLSYRFTSPASGREIKKTEKVFLPDLNSQGLPPTGMAVAVLYRTDKHFRVL